MDKIKLLLILSVGLLIIPSIAAQPAFNVFNIDFEVGLTPVQPVYVSIKQNTDYTLVVHVLNSSNGVLITNVTANCTAHLFAPTGSEQYEQDMDFDVEGNDFNLILDKGNFSTLGQYNSLVRCFDDTRGGVKESFVHVTPNGELLTEGEGSLYASIIIIAVLFLISLITLSIKIPFRNSKEINGIQMIVNNFRVYKIGAIFLTYLVLMWLFGLLNNAAASYLALSGIANLFKWAYLIMLYMAFPLGILAIVLGFMAVIFSIKLEKLHERFGDG